MSRSCTVCFHPQRDEIDKALALRTGSFRALAAQHDLSETAVHRHAREHLGLAMRNSKEMQAAASVSYLVKEMVALHERTLRLLEIAEARVAAGGSVDPALRGVTQVRANLELFYKLLALGEVQQRLEAVESDDSAEEPAEGDERHG